VLYVAQGAVLSSPVYVAQVTVLSSPVYVAQGTVLSSPVYVAQGKVLSSPVQEVAVSLFLYVMKETFSQVIKHCSIMS
jgi:hypothetical protein